MHFNPTAITFIGYLVLMVMIGFYAWHHTRSFGDYILGDVGRARDAHQEPAAHVGRAD